jgi:hypothetical protein
MTDRSKKRLAVLKIAAITCAVVFVAIQAIRPARTNPPTDSSQTLEATMHPPPNVARLLQRGCADCHTNNTVWPWYTNIAPLSWWIVNHVNEGRRHASFSEWARYDRGRQAQALAAACARLERHDMPLPSYLLMHRDARLTDAERGTICDWTRSAADASP